MNTISGQSTATTELAQGTIRHPFVMEAELQVISQERGMAEVIACQTLNVSLWGMKIKVTEGRTEELRGDGREGIRFARVTVADPQTGRKIRLLGEIVWTSESPEGPAGALEAGLYISPRQQGEYRHFESLLQRQVYFA